MLRKKRRIFDARKKDWNIFDAASKTHNTASMRNLPLVSSENIGRRREGKPSKSAASRRGLFFSTWDFIIHSWFRLRRVRVKCTGKSKKPDTHELLNQWPLNRHVGSDSLKSSLTLIGYETHARLPGSLTGVHGSHRGRHRSSNRAG